MKYYSNDFRKAFMTFYNEAIIAAEHSFIKNHDLSGISVKMWKNEPLQDNDVKNIRNAFQHLLMWSKGFRSDRRRVDNVLWLLDTMDDDCRDFSDYEADIIPTNQNLQQ